MNTFFAFYQNIGPALTLLVVLTFLLAGAVKGVIGLGLPTIAMGLLGLAMPPAQAAVLLIVPSTLTNLWQLAAGGHLRALVRRLGGVLLMIFVGTLLGSRWLGIDSGPWAAHALGGALVVYALYGLIGPGLRLARHHERWLGPLCGLVTGVVTAATGVFVMPAVPYLQSLGLSRDEMVQALGLSFTVSTLALAIGLAARRYWTARRWVPHCWCWPRRCWACSPVPGFAAVSVQRCSGAAFSSAWRCSAGTC